METANKKDKKATQTSTTQISGLDRQRSFLLASQQNGQNGDSFFITHKVMESMRDSGYRDIRKALNDLIDNSEQAGAKKISISTTIDREDVKHARERISNIAVIDDGHGMFPDMLKFAIAWGGTDRHNERDGLGRFGFGLPTAAISVTPVYEVYSKVKGGQWHKVKVDLTHIAAQALVSGGNVSFVPEVEKGTLPEFVLDNIKNIWGKKDIEQGTVVLLLNPDRIRSFATPQIFQTKMLHNVGLTYRHFMPDVSFYVNEKKVQMIDPLFLNPNCIGYDIGNGYKAEGLDEMIIPVKNKVGNDKTVVGDIKLRFSYMNPEFQNDKDGPRGKSPLRMNTMQENNGYFIVCRSGRQIDIVRDTNYQSDADNTTIVNYDVNWAIEVDFEPVLDELFGITTNKQQVEIDASLWDIFKDNGVPGIVKGFRKRTKTIKIEEEIAEEKKKDAPRTSETIMAEADRIDTVKIPREKKEKAKNKLVEKAEEIAAEKNEDVADVIEKLETKTQKEKFKIEFASHPGAPFYDIDQWGQQIIIRINTAHGFYSDIYSQQDPRGKTALELLLFVLATSELEATDDKLLFYGNERFEWSKKLDLRLKILDKKEPLVDRQSHDEEHNN